MQILDFIIKKIIINFNKWNSEPNLLEKSCDLLLTISLSKNLVIFLIQLQSWKELINSYMYYNQIFSPSK